MGRITIAGWYDYMPEIFDDFSYLAEAGIMPENLKRQIVMRYGDLYTYHQDPSYIKQNIHDWVLINRDNWIKKWQAYTTEYKPLENYNRTEESTTTENGGWSGTIEQTTGATDAGSNSTQGSVTDDGTNSNTTTPNLTSSNSGGIETQVSAFNDSSYSPSNKTIDTTSNTQSGTTQTTGSIGNSQTSGSGGEYDTTQSGTLQGSDSRNTNNTQITNSNVHGNIGVTTSQQMLQAEMELRSWVLYDEICAMFESTFLVRVY